MEDLNSGEVVRDLSRASHEAGRVVGVSTEVVDPVLTGVQPDASIPSADGKVYILSILNPANYNLSAPAS